MEIVPNSRASARLGAEFGVRECAAVRVCRLRAAREGEDEGLGCETALLFQKRGRSFARVRRPAHKRFLTARRLAVVWRCASIEVAML